MLYAAKCYWPGVTRTDLEQVAVEHCRRRALIPAKCAQQQRRTERTICMPSFLRSVS